MEGQLESVRLLLDRGADKEAKTSVRGDGRGGGWVSISDVPLPSFDSL